MTLYLRAEGHDVAQTYVEFRADFDRKIAQLSDKNAIAFLWDRVGHWAQDEDNWTEAEFCFRKAYDLAGGHYGYCLGTALNFLQRFKESLSFLREQASSTQPDAMSWFQLGVAYCGLGDSCLAIEAYQNAFSLDPTYDLALFNLGGTYWNMGDTIQALKVWTMAIDRFPNHELSDKLRRDIPAFSLSDSN